MNPAPTEKKTPDKTKYPSGSYFTQTKGPRSGQDFKVKKGKSGLSVRVYKSGDTALASAAPAQGRAAAKAYGDQ